MAEVLNVEVRDTRGKRNSRRLRKAGNVPGILYGHGLENVCLAVPSDALNSLVRHGNRLVSLKGAASESAFIRAVQWDTWGTNILHVDFTRISEHEKVSVEVAVELRGEAPGVREGGIIEQSIHSIGIECPAGSIPEKIKVSINELKLHDLITVAELELPAGATVSADATAVVVQCSEPTLAPEDEVAEAVAGEPEVIGAKEKEEESKEI